VSARRRFVERTLDWLAARLAPPGVVVAADTPLFATGIISSIRVLELIAWTEREIGREIADVEIRLDNFRTVARIAEVFVKEDRHAAA
jgi:acyl carrier protein